jgi:hypothetical protein
MSNNIAVDQVKATLKLHFRGYWENKVSVGRNQDGNSGGKLRTYRTFKTGCHLEPYIDLLKCRKLRTTMAHFRTSTHCLNIEVGRYTRKAVSERKCELCSLDKIEDEVHFLTECPKYENEREKLYNCIASHNKNFRSLPYTMKFIWLMSNEDKESLFQIATFLSNSFEVRNHTLGITVPPKARQ